MGEIVNAYILPHPPIIVPGIGEGREKTAAATIEACRKAALAIAGDRPGTILLSTPHAPGFRDFIVLSDADRLTGDFGAFGHPEIVVDFENNHQLASDISHDAQAKKINAGFLSDREKRQYRLSDRIDHGAMVPLYFIAKALADARLKCKVVLISTPFLPMEEIYLFGQSIQKTISESRESVVYIASGDLSHRLTPDSPAGYSPYGKVYDQMIVDTVTDNKVKELLRIREEEMEDAGQCGTRSIAMMYGALSGVPLKTMVYSYEGPFGVGYLAAKIEPQRGE